MNWYYSRERFKPEIGCSYPVTCKIPEQGTGL